MRCPHCQLDMPREAFAPSQRFKGAWCRCCMAIDKAQKRIVLMENKRALLARQYAHGQVSR